MNILFFLIPKKEVAYMYSNNSVRQVLEKMEANHFTAIPVLNRSGKYEFSVSEGDILRAIKKENYDIKKAEKIMISSLNLDRKIEPITIDKDIDDLILLISNQNFVPVIDDYGNFIGIITRKAVLEYCHKELNNK